MTLANLEKILLFLVVLFLPTQLGKHFWPQFAYIYSLKIDYLSPTLYFWDILVLGFLAVWILQKPKINHLALNLLLVFLFTQALSLIGAGNIGAGLVRLEQYVLAGFFGVFLASSDFKSVAKRIFLPLALGILGEFLIAITQFLKGSTIGLWILGERTFTISTPAIAKFDFYGYEFLRPYATFPHPNVLAGFTLVTIVILYFFSVIANPALAGRGNLPSLITKWSGRFSSSLSPEGSSLRVEDLTLFGMTVVMSGITIFLTMSRAAILAGFIALVILLRRKWIIIIFIITIILSPILFTRFSSLLNFDNLTFARREELIGNAWQMFVKSPIFGVGLNNFIPVQAANLITGPSRFLQPVHNIFFLELAETGIIGLVGFLVLIGYPIRKIFNFQFLIFKLLPWLIIIFLGMFDHYFLTLPQGYRMLFLVWGLSFSRLQKLS